MSTLIPDGKMKDAALTAVSLTQRNCFVNDTSLS